jgi:hypothetical protein
MEKVFLMGIKKLQFSKGKDRAQDEAQQHKEMNSY